jgi:hypothetical protein
LCVATLGDGRVRSSFVVVRRRGRSSYYSYAIIKAPQSNKTNKKGGRDIYVFFSFNDDGQLAKQRGQKKGGGGGDV